MKSARQKHEHEQRTISLKSKIALIVAAVTFVLALIAGLLTFFLRYQFKELHWCPNIWFLAACIFSAVCSLLNLGFLIAILIISQEHIVPVRKDVKFSLFTLMDLVLRVLVPREFQSQMFVAMSGEASTMKALSGSK